jgi:hypothetical protein
MACKASSKHTRDMQEKIGKVAVMMECTSCIRHAAGLPYRLTEAVSYPNMHELYRFLRLERLSTL